VDSNLDRCIRAFKEIRIMLGYNNGRHLTMIEKINKNLGTLKI